MKKKSTSNSAFFNLRVLIASVLCLFGVVVALIGFGLYPGASLLAQSRVSNRHNNGNPIGLSFTHLITTFQRPCAKWQPGLCHLLSEHEAPENPKIGIVRASGSRPDTVVQNTFMDSLLGSIIPGLNFDGIPFPGVDL